MLSGIVFTTFDKMVLFRLVVVSFAVCAIVRAEIPSHLANGFKNAQTLDEFLSFVPISNDSQQLSADFHRGRDGIANRCNLPDSCALVPVCVPVEPDINDSESPYFPNCVKLNRCLDSSHDHRKYCNPIIDKVAIKIIHFKYTGNQGGYCSIRKVSMQNHTGCIQEIKNSRNHKPKRKQNRGPSRPANRQVCDSYDQCYGNPNGEEPKTRDDCNEYEQFNAECCSCICQCPLVNEICNCGQDDDMED